jgi:hypothetical protein
MPSSNGIAHPALVFLLLLAVQPSALHAQQESQTPNLPSSQDPDGLLTLHASTHLVLLDVTVLDWKSNPVTGLKQENFHVSEDGHIQTVKNFEEHVPIDPKVARERLAALANALPQNTFTNLKPFPTSPTVNVVVMDTLTSRVDTQQNSQQDLVAYMSRVPPGTPFIIFKLDTQLHMIQGLSMDPAVLRAAVGEKRLTLTPSPLTSPMQDREIIGAAVDQLTKYLGGIPGRKTLLWFSGGLGVDLGYPVDLYCKWTDQLQQNRIAAFRYLPERRFASGLGCSPGYNVDGSIAGVVDSASHFYTLSYTPTNGVWNGKYRKFNVKVTETGRHGLSLAYRQGYYGRADDGSVHSAEPTPPATSKENPALQKAMGMGSPEPDDVIFEAVVTPAAAITRDDIVASAGPGNYLSPALRRQGYRDYQLQFAVRANQLKPILSPDQTACAEKIEVVAVLYDSAGNPVNSKKNRVSATFDTLSDPRIEKATVTADLAIQIPAKGSYFLRLGVLDPASGKVGAIEVPADRIALPPK